MTRHRFYHHNQKNIRDLINEAIAKADQIQALEKELVEILRPIDQERYYVWAGYNSLRGFCNIALRFTRTQSQRIATEVRRS